MKKKMGGGTGAGAGAAAAAAAAGGGTGASSSAATLMPLEYSNSSSTVGGILYDSPKPHVNYRFLNHNHQYN